MNGDSGRQELEGAIASFDCRGVMTESKCLINLIKSSLGEVYEVSRGLISDHFGILYSLLLTREDACSLT